MKGYFRFNTTASFRFSKRFFLSIFLFIFLLGGVGNVFAQNNDPYINWKTLFGDTTSTPSREELKSRERSGLLNKGVKQNGCYILQSAGPGIPQQPQPTVPTFVNPVTCPKLTNNPVVGIINTDIYASLDKTLTYLAKNPSHVLLEGTNATNPTKKSEYVYDMIAKESGGTSNARGNKDNDAFILRTQYETTRGEKKTTFTTIENEQDSVGKTQNIDAQSFIIDYDEVSTEIQRQSVIKNVFFGNTLETAARPGSVISVDFWYCAGTIEDREVGTDGISRVVTRDGTTAIGDGNRVLRNIKDQTGRTLCGGTAYYKIGQTIESTLPRTIEEVVLEQQTNADLLAGATRIARSSNLPACNISLTGGEWTILGCIAQALYWVIFTPIAFIAGLLGQIFDFFLAYSLSDESYRMDFVENAWRLVRDLANIFFIIIMVWSGLSAVFNTEKTSFKNVVPTLIINAIIINFSLFATRVVIDISNITARLFYNQITVSIDGTTSTTSVKPISEAIVSSFNPQRVFDGVLTKEISVIAPDQGGVTSNVNFNAQGIATEGQWSAGDKDYAQYFIIVTIIAALIMWGVAMMFWKTAFLFVGRVVQLYLSMIFAPFAFLSRGSVPLVNKIKQLNWDTWWGDLSKAATMAPIFVFFLYIINAFLGVEFFNKVSMMRADQGFIDRVIKILIPMLIVYTLISKAVSVARSLSTSVGTLVQDQVGSVANKVAGTAGTVALGVASGGAALAGRSVLARGARGIQQNSKLGSWVQRNQENKYFGGTARLMNKTLSGAQTASYDARNTKAFGKLTEIAGKDLGIKMSGNNAAVGALNLGTKQFEGGLKVYDKRKEKEVQEKVEGVTSSFASKEEAQAFYEDKQAREFAKEKGYSRDGVTDKNARMQKDAEKTIFAAEAKKELENKKSNGLITSFSQADIDALAKANKKQWEDRNKTYIDEYTAFKKEQEKTYGVVKDNDTLTQALRLRYADKLKENSRTLWNTIRQLGVPTGITTADALYETETKQKAAGKYGEDKRKQFKKEQKILEAEEQLSKDINDMMKAIYASLTTEMREKLDEVKKGDGYDHTGLSDRDRDELLRVYRKNKEVEIDLFKETLEELKNKHKNDPGHPTHKRNYEEALATMAELKENKESGKNIANKYRTAAEKVEKLKGEKKEAGKPKDEKK